VFHLFERASTDRPEAKRDIASLTKFTLRMLAGRAITLEEEVNEIDAVLKPLVKEPAPELVSTIGTRTDAASFLLVNAGDNPERLRNEAAFAQLCAASPIDASSGKTSGTG
jgi:transposase